MLTPFACSTDCGRGERLGLSWKQVDFQWGRITISQQLQQKKTGGCEYFLAPTTKSGNPRTTEPPITFENLRAEERKQA